RLTSVSFVNPNVGTAVGWGGTIIRTADGGRTWTPQDSGTTDILFSVHFVDADTGTAVGYFATILRTENGGTTWTRQIPRAGYPYFFSVAFVDRNVGTVVGWWFGHHPESVIWGTTDGGKTWTPRDVDANVGPFSVAFGGATTGAIVGSDAVILRSTDAGTTWFPQQLPGTHLSFVSFLDAKIGYAVGEGILRAIDGGETWTPQDNPADFLGSVSFADANVGMAVGGGGTIIGTTTGGDDF